MGQLMSRYCVDCNSNLTTQEDIVHESSKKSIRRLRELLENIDDEEIIEFESPRNKDERHMTQRSSININTSRDTDHSALTSKAIPRSSSHPILHSPKLQSQNHHFQGSVQENSLNSSLSSFSNSHIFNYPRYKTRSSNFSHISVNLVETVRNSPVPKRISKYN
ncbi:hypothetical protein SteCoe_29967 [Stentor coeruleus]|uniref:Uncharacterized protein n=1 Tax=Stentor coeruleus TaxID=5963 RepID=A0A1R2B4N2_9CILI|nr:hypothetical protein SteCoe_29967 [Stentor coeruleus]